MNKLCVPNGLKFSVITVAIVAMTGCATTTGLSKYQCEQLAQNSTDWQKLGEQDGLMGRGAGYFAKHLQACGKVTNMSPTVMTTPTAFVAQNQQAWEAGRQAGLKKYCTPLRAYQLGREGFSYHNVCPQAQMVELLKANDEGLYNYQREQNLRDWDDDFFPFGWGYGGIRGGRGWNNHWRGGGRFYAPVPRVLPKYVPEKRAE